MPPEIEPLFSAGIYNNVTELHFLLFVGNHESVVEGTVTIVDYAKGICLMKQRIPPFSYVLVHLPCFINFLQLDVLL